jgi:hypothetical protein
MGFRHKGYLTMEGKFMCVEYGVRDGVWVGVMLPFVPPRESRL